MKKIIFALFIVGSLMYHGRVLKAEKIYEVRIYRQWKDGNISQEEYQRLNTQNSYFKHAFDLKEVFSALQ